MKIFQIYGNPSLTRWDVGRRLIVTEACSSVHFANDNMEEAMVCQVAEMDGVRLVRIPDEVLQVSGRLVVYAFVAGEEGYTKRIQEFFVKDKPKPANYVYTPTEAMTWEGLHERISALEESGGGSGGSGTNGEDGYSVLYFTGAVTGGTVIVANITKPDGYTVKKGDMLVSADGLLYQVASDVYTDVPGEVADVEFLGTLKGKDGYTPQKGTDYFDGEDGADGTSPVISVSAITGGHRLTITDAGGTKTVDVMDGEDGSNGAAGKGIKTIARTSGSGTAGTSDTYTITYTDNTTSTFTVYNGKNGADGYTPVKGVDYFTDADKKEFLQDMGIFEEVGKTSISNNLCDGVYEWGSLNSSGDEVSLSPENYGFITANYLPVEGGKQILWNADTTTTGTITQLYCICEYDANKSLVLRTKTIAHAINQWDTSKGITLQANTAYVRFYIYNGENVVDLDAIKINLFYVENIEQFFTGDGSVFVYVPHIITESAGEFIPLEKVQTPLTGKKIVYDGDSICIGTYGGGGYAKIIADKVGGTYENQAVGGARLQTREGSASSFHSVVDNLENLPTDADLYCFNGGVNDVWSSVSLGTYDMSDYTGEVDKTTICGALETIFRYCLDNFVGKPVCYIITHKVSSISFENYKNYHDSAVAICNKYSIPYYDAYNESGLNGWNTAQNNAFLTGNVNGTPDGCHPNEAGYKRYYVPQLIALFEKIMPVE